MSNATLQEKIVEGLEDGEIFFADPGVTIATISIAEYAVVRKRGLETLQQTDFSMIDGGLGPATFRRVRPSAI